MGQYHPTEREAADRMASIERMIPAAQVCEEIEGGFWMRWPRHKHGFEVMWPVSRIDRRCDDCGAVLLGRRDAGGQGFYYDPRWLEGDASRRDPRKAEGYRSHHVCMSCLNRARAKIRAVEAVNDTRLLINRIKRELRDAA